MNAAQPSLEGRNLLDLKDLDGRFVVREEIEVANRQGRAWMNLTWFKPGDNTPARTRSHVRTVQFGKETYVVGSAIYFA